MKNNKKAMIVIGVVGALIVFSLNIYKDTKIKDLDDVLNFKPNDFKTFGFTVNRDEITGNKAFEWQTENTEPVEELLSFLEHYKVKKADINEISGKENFEFMIFHNISKPINVVVVDENEMLIGETVFEVINEPIDMEWVKNFNQKYNNQY
ncbi:hypothetical protein E3U55_16905 [Filobacillus milosensis]|uniref:Uncharacterized protein n=1 Tax=Filobacillus milosensis TaxID=94137 RepID=A0A4Y8IAE8_9BACI|nr:hypothetical protein [Filobacillus milosensis]TFB12910.1 hypothetical protein E3U55_16905 [Filobacillus milosensis]